MLSRMKNGLDPVEWAATNITNEHGQTLAVRMDVSKSAFTEQEAWGDRFYYISKVAWINGKVPGYSTLWAYQLTEEQLRALKDAIWRFTDRGSYNLEGYLPDRGLVIFSMFYSIGNWHRH